MRKRREASLVHRDEILAAALEVFSEVGYERASTRQIAARAGLEQGHLVYYFPTKRQLWVSVIETSSRGLMTLLESEGRIEKSESAPDAAARLLPKVLGCFAANPNHTRLMLQEFSVGSDRRDWVLAKFGRPIWLTLKPLFMALEEEGRLGGAPAAIAYFAFIGGALVTFGSAPELRLIADVALGNEAIKKAQISNLMRAVLARA